MYQSILFRKAFCLLLNKIFHKDNKDILLIFRGFISFSLLFYKLLRILCIIFSYAYTGDPAPCTEKTAMFHHLIVFMVKKEP